MPFSSSAARESRLIVEDERALVVARFPSLGRVAAWEVVSLSLSMLGVKEEECCGLFSIGFPIIARLTKSLLLTRTTRRATSL